MGQISQCIAMHKLPVQMHELQLPLGNLNLSNTSWANIYFLSPLGDTITACTDLCQRHWPPGANVVYLTMIYPAVCMHLKPWTYLFPLNFNGVNNCK